MSKLIVSLSPHAHSRDSIERNMYGVIIALMPALLASFYLWLGCGYRFRYQCGCLLLL